MARFRVVAIGGSAGGLEATRQLLESIPAHTGMAYVVIHHLAVSTPSLLPEILARSSSLPVVSVTDRMRVEPDHVYVMPEGFDLEIKDYTLLLIPRSSAARHLPIDHFMILLAERMGSNAIGVVLSGAGSDGTKGVQAMRAHGGTTFAQDPRTASKRTCLTMPWRRASTTYFLRRA